MAISGLLRRMGFVKLDNFGLILTPEGRILSTRADVLVDGLGGKIVGWLEDDLAAMELERWEPARPRKRRKVISAPPPLPNARPAAAAAPAAPVAPPKPVAAPVVSAAPSVQAPPKVDPEPIEEDDEWEWEIAMARARAAAEWAEEAAQVTQPAARAKRATSPIELVVKSRRKDPIQTDNWPKTEPLMEQWDGPSPVVRVLPRAPSPTPPKPIVIAHAPVAAMPAAPVAREFALRPPAPTPTSPTIVTSAPRATVIPVPTLSRAVDPKSITPRTRTNTAPLPRPPASVMAPPKRYPRSTDPVGATTEDTLVNGTAAPANDDATTPGLILPPASSTRRVAAKQR